MEKTNVSETKANLVAADILKPDHPLHNAFLAFLGSKSENTGEEIKMTKRQARKFLDSHPQYRTVKTA